MTHVLIIDDSPTEVHVFRTILEKHEIQVSVASDGEEGIEKALEMKPDCILMDVVMPGKNGFQATRDLSRNPNTSSIPVIIITTKDQETDKIWAMRQGAKDYIVKPASEADLIDRINKVLGQTGMPITSPFKLLQAMDANARKNSAGLPVNKSVVDDWTGIGFNINGIPLLTKTDEITEILPPPETVRVPGVKHWVKGLANVRGSLMPVIDMKSYLFGEDTELHKDSRILIINRRGLVAGLLVDEVYGLRRFKPEECQQEFDPDSGPVRDYLNGVFIDRIQRWNVFSVDKLVQTEQFIRVV